MKNTSRRIILLPVALAICLALSGCAPIEEIAEPTAEPTYSVDIVVPYIVSTPVPEADVTANPLTISADGKVSLNDSNWINSDFSGSDSDSAANSYSQLRLGDSGTNVRNLQTRLKALSYYSGEISGVFDSDTENAVKLFELTYGKMQTGIATAKLQQLLYASNAPAYNSNAYRAALEGNYKTLQFGDTGTSVYAMQERFIALGYPLGEATGIFDAETANVVELFYLEYGLEKNYTAIVALQKELFSDSAKRYSGAETAPSTGQYTLSIGNIGSRVTALQERLAELGYLAEHNEGTFDTATFEAICAFEDKLGLGQTGVATGDLQDLLYSASAPSSSSDALPAGSIRASDVLAEGSTGEEVAQLQQRLVLLGYPDVRVSGVYDAATKNAVGLLQSTADLEQTGTVSEALLEYIHSSYAKTYASGQLKSGTHAAELVELTVGAAGDAVVALQTRLYELGYLVQIGDGTYDEATATAVALLQSTIGVEVTGLATPSFQQYLQSNAVPTQEYKFYDKARSFEALALGDSGDSVTELQKQLWTMKYLAYDSIEDSVGTYNNATQIAVANAQLAMGYAEADGAASVEFQAFLFSKYRNRFITD